jgi:dienelactone hydrolase
MQRREFLAFGAGFSFGCLLPGSLHAAGIHDVEWLADVTRPPGKLPIPDRPLAPLLVDASGQSISTWKDWEAQRQRIRDAWLAFLGPMPVERPPVKLEVLNQSLIEFPSGGECHRTLVRYQAEADEFVEGYLLRPVGDRFPGRRPGIVALHQTSQNSIDEIAEVEVARPGNQNLAFQLCEQGFVVFCPRCYLWQTPPDFKIDVKTTVERFHQRHPNTLGMHKMLFDAQRAVDVLVSLDEVDPKRIGTVGHSLGAKEVLYLMAFDERVKAGVASEGGIAFSSTNWHDPWYLGAGIKDPEFRLNHHQLLALIAPRPLLILGGESGPGAADGDRSWPYVVEAQSVYGLDEGRIRLGLLNHHRGHSIPDDVRDKLFEWLRVYTEL